VTSTPLDQLRDRIVAFLSDEPTWTFKEALKDGSYETWVPGKRIRGVYIGAFVAGRNAFRAIIAKGGTVQMFRDGLSSDGELVVELERKLDHVAVGTFTEIECLGKDRFNVRARPKPMKEFQ
jgi:hypothetical protein